MKTTKILKALLAAALAAALLLTALPSALALDEAEEAANNTNADMITELCWYPCNDDTLLGVLCMSLDGGYTGFGASPKITLDLVLPDGTTERFCESDEENLLVEFPREGDTLTDVFMRVKDFDKHGYEEAVFTLTIAPNSFVTDEPAEVNPEIKTTFEAWLVSQLYFSEWDLYVSESDDIRKNGYTNYFGSSDLFAGEKCTIKKNCYGIKYEGTPNSRSGRSFPVERWAEQVELVITDSKGNAVEQGENGETVLVEGEITVEAKLNDFIKETDTLHVKPKLTQADIDEIKLSAAFNYWLFSLTLPIQAPFVLFYPMGLFISLAFLVAPLLSFSELILVIFDVALLG